MNSFCLSCSSSFLGKGPVNSHHLALLGRYNIRHLELTIRKGYVDIFDSAQLAFWERAVKGGMIVAHSAHVYMGDDEGDMSSPDEDMRKEGVQHIIHCMNYLDQLKTQCLVVHAGDKDIKDSERDRRLYQSKKSLMEIERYSRNTGVRIACEILHYPFIPKDTVETQAILKDCDPGRIGVCMDVNNVNLSEDLPDAIEKMNGRIYGFHFSDNDGKRERHWCPFEGIIDWRKVMGAIRKIGYTGPLNFEFGEVTEDTLEEEIKKRVFTFEKLVRL